MESLAEYLRGVNSSHWFAFKPEQKGIDQLENGQKSRRQDLGEIAMSVQFTEESSGKKKKKEMEKHSIEKKLSQGEEESNGKLNSSCSGLCL